MGLWRTHKRGLVIGGLVLIVFCLISSLLFRPQYYVKEYLSRVPFDSAKWREKPSIKSENPYRSRMVDDLIRKHNFRGMSRGEVVAVLGEPDDPEEVSTEPEELRGWDIAYHVGLERNAWLRSNSEWLVMRLNAEGRVAEYRLLID